MTDEEVRRIINLNTIREDLQAMVNAVIRSISFREREVLPMLEERFTFVLSKTTKPELVRILNNAIQELNEEIEKL